MAEISATFLHTGYFNILLRTGAEQKEMTSENQRFSEVFCRLIDPLVIRVEPLNSDAVCCESMR